MRSITTIASGCLSYQGAESAVRIQFVCKNDVGENFWRRVRSSGAFVVLLRYYEDDKLLAAIGAEFVWLIKRSQWDVVKKLLSLHKRNPDLVARDAWMECDSNGQTPLHAAARCADVAILELLIKKLSTDDKKKALVNAKDKTGKTPLYYVCKYKRHQQIKLLLEHGADVWKMDSRDLELFAEYLRKDPSIFGDDSIPRNTRRQLLKQHRRYVLLNGNDEPLKKLHKTFAARVSLVDLVRETFFLTGAREPDDNSQARPQNIFKMLAGVKLKQTELTKKSFVSEISASQAERRKAIKWMPTPGLKRIPLPKASGDTKEPDLLDVFDLNVAEIGKYLECQHDRKTLKSTTEKIQKNMDTANGLESVKKWMARLLFFIHPGFGVMYAIRRPNFSNLFLTSMSGILITIGAGILLAVFHDGIVNAYLLAFSGINTALGMSPSTSLAAFNIFLILYAANSFAESAMGIYAVSKRIILINEIKEISGTVDDLLKNPLMIGAEVAEKLRQNSADIAKLDRNYEIEELVELLETFNMNIDAIKNVLLVTGKSFSPIIDEIADVEVELEELSAPVTQKPEKSEEVVIEIPRAEISEATVDSLLQDLPSVRGLSVFKQAIATEDESEPLLESSVAFAMPS